VATIRDPDPLAPWFGRLSEPFGEDRWQPAADVFETADAIVIRLELAGVAGGDVSVTVDGEVLRIRGHRKPRIDAEAQRLHQMEIASGPFERALRIGVPFDRDGVSASLEEGLLRVVLPKRNPGPRRIGVSKRDEGSR
jgi:HSP20 family protein